LSKKRLQLDEVKRLVGPFIAYVIHPIDQGVVRRALFIFERYKTSWWDALMIAWAAQAGCSMLLSEDSQSASVIEGVRIVSPFSIEPSALKDLGQGLPR
jgi:predicted nucleic acid-binding protein